MERIAIAGAGPSGLTAAINLAKAGFAVKVYEKERDVGRRFHGDFQGIENWTTEEDVLREMKGINIKVNFLCAPYRRVDFYSHDLERYGVRLEKPLFYLVKRGPSGRTLDQGLKEQALDSGVEISFGKRTGPKEADIMATGPRRVFGVVSGITFKTNIGNKALVVLDDNIAPKGYAYLLVNKGEATMSTVILKNFENRKSYLEKTMEKFRSIFDFDMKDAKEFTSYGNFFLKRSWTKSGGLYAGEGAGFQDALWGFGMRYAMTSGFLAARSIIENESYDSLVKENILGKMKTSFSNRFLFENMGNRGYKYFLDMGINKNNARSFLRKHHNPSFFKKMVFPLARLKFRNRI
jgi:flavin-dependent dehydrogenase